jgi:outer membrane protein assembly factor BamB
MPKSLKRVPTVALVGAGALVVALFVVVVLVLGSSGSSEPKPAFTGSGYPNGDVWNTRAAHGSITQATVAGLRKAWSLPLTAQSKYGADASSPIIANGVVYSQDLVSNVQAISLRSGKVLWTKVYDSPDQGPNGIVVAAGRVFGATATSAFALDQRTGREVWQVELARTPIDGVDMAPGYHDGLVYVSTVPGNNQKFYGEGAVGVLWALDANTGKKVWQFKTAQTERWSPKHVAVNLGGGLWHTPAFDDHGGMYFGVGNAGPFPGTDQYPWGSSRPGPDLYTDSLVKLDAKSGKLRWYYQLTPHDLYDWDLQDPPILGRVMGKPAVIPAGKAGVVIAVDRKRGRLLWKRSVGKHNGHDKDPIYAMKGEYAKLHLDDEIYPGLLGGVIAPMSSDGTTVFAPVVNHSVAFTSQTESQESSAATGELVAIDVDTGAVKWDQTFPTPAFGATTVVNDLVFATTFDGHVYAFDTRTGNPAWEATLPAGTNTGVTIQGDTVIAPAGIGVSQGQTPALVAYRLGGG